MAKNASDAMVDTPITGSSVLLVNAAGSAAALAGAVTGAVTGSVVPVVGNVAGAILGFIVGLGIYYLTDTMDVEGKTIRDHAKDAVSELLSGETITGERAPYDVNNLLYGD